MAEWFPDVRGKFGCDEENTWPVTIGMDEKGGMDDAEFEKYVFGSIIPLYPNASSVKFKWVVIKVSIIPGRLKKTLLARLQILGFILYHGVPNTTVVTQETDWYYGSFQTQLRNNLELVLWERLSKKVCLSMQPWLSGIMIFGGADPGTGYLVETSAFEVGFALAHCKNAWAKIGAAPLTMACLTDTKVLWKLGNSDDHTNNLMRDFQDANDLAVFKLSQQGLGGSMLSVRVEKVPETEPITVKHSRDWVKALANLKTHRAKFTATGVGNVTTNEMFKSMEMDSIEKGIKSMEDGKKSRKNLAYVEDKAMEALACVGSDFDQLKATKLTDLLRWYQVPPNKLGGKDSNYNKWLKIYGVDPPPYLKWTNVNEYQRVELKKREINISNKALGCHQETNRR